MILVEFPVRTTPDGPTYRHVFCLEDLKEVIEMEDGQSTLIRLASRKRPLVVAQTMAEVMQHIHGLFQQIAAQNRPQPQIGLALPNGVALRRH